MRFTTPLGRQRSRAPHCEYFASGRCRSCTFIEMPIEAQLAAKRERLASLLPGIPEAAWLPPVPGGVAGFRNRAKLAVGGVPGAVTLGILDRGGDGVDLSDCLIHEAGIRAVIPVLARFLDATGLAPYRVPDRNGELKYVHLTLSPSGELMIRFVVRSETALDALRTRVRDLRARIPNARVISVNLLPEHKAVLEGEREELLHGTDLEMRLGEVALHLLPQSFFQTNTRVARALYEQVAEWVRSVRPRALWDLYCGVGGFALFAAGRGAEGTEPASVLGVELSGPAVRSAQRSAREMGSGATFLSADATEFALGAAPELRPELVIVNPPRRGIGEALAAWIEDSGIRHIVYSSCNPESLALDLERMPSLRVREARLFDMFPHTGHLEVAVLLERSGSDSGVGARDRG